MKLAALEYRDIRLRPKLNKLCSEEKAVYCKVGGDDAWGKHLLSCSFGSLGYCYAAPHTLIGKCEPAGVCAFTKTHSSLL